MKDNTVRVRFAPSPTGALHIGGVRTALYNYLFAKQQGGKLILRIEDTDSKRFVDGSEAYILDAFNWLGIEFDEGIENGKACYHQSERKEIYRKYVDLLLEQDLAYIAFDTPEELDVKRKEQANFQYDASTRDEMNNSLVLSKEEVAAKLANNEVYVVRIKITPNVDVVVNDLIRGEVKINSSVLDDKVIFKSADKLPTYHLASVVDDHLMEISHVIRGEEWLPSAPLHVLLYKYLGWESSMPTFAHLPLLLKPDGNGKLSKRDGDRLGFPVFPLDWKDPKSGAIFPGYREMGYFPEAVINFLSLLGWHDDTDQELFSMSELIEKFSLQKVSKSGAKFDFEKGKWFNKQYLHSKSDTELAQLFIEELQTKGIETTIEELASVIALTKERCTFVADFWEQTYFFFQAPLEYDAKTRKKRWKADAPAMMEQLYSFLEGIEDFSAKNTEKLVMAWITENELHMGKIMNAFRLAIVGAGKGPHMFDIITFIGKEETLKRLRTAITTLV